MNQGGEGERTRFVGKHSKDHMLSLYLLHRTITESSNTVSDTLVEPLQVVIRCNPELINRKIYLGVIGRLVCDYGLQLAEHIVFQVHISLNFSSAKSPTTTKSFAESVFDTETRFITLPDQLHQGVLVRLPPGMPPSMSLLTNLPNETWGLTYYLCAFQVDDERVSNATCWDLLKLAKSKVVLSFAKRLTHDQVNNTSIPTPVTNKRSSLTSSKGVTLTASLDKTSFLINNSSIEDILLNIKLLNPARTTITGFKITLKQIVTVRFAGEARQTIKSTFGKHEFRSVFAEHDPLNTSNDRSRRIGVPIEELCKDACSFADTFTIKPKLESKLAYQLALQSSIPKSTTHSLSPSFKFDGLTASIGGGLDRLRYFSVEYYANVHAVFKWSRNLIVKLPFILYDDGSNFVLSEASSPVNIPRQPSVKQRMHYEGFSEADMDTNALNLLAGKLSSQVKHAPKTIVHEDLLDLGDDGDDFTMSRTPSNRALLHRRKDVREVESSEDEDEDSKETMITQNHLSWEEDLQIAMSELSNVKRTMSMASSVMDLETLELDLFESCNEAIMLMEQLVKQKAVACKLVNHIINLIIPLSSVLMNSAEDQEQSLDQWIDTVEVLFGRLRRKKDDSIEDVLNALRRLSIDMCPTIRDTIMTPMLKFVSLLHEAECCVMLDSQFMAMDSFQDCIDASEFATAFQSLTDALLSSEESGALSQLQAYLSCLYPFFTQTISASHLHSIAAFWHCQFALLAIATCLSPTSTLLLLLITPCSWSPHLLSKIPSFYTPIDIKSFPQLLKEQQSQPAEKWQSRLVLCGNLVIESMKCLFDQ